MTDSTHKASNEMIFIVDDTIENIDVMSKILEEKNYSISFAESGEEALELIPNVMPDLILMDVMMPGIDGFQTCERLKAMEQLYEIPVIFVTAKNESQDILNALHAGAVDYITKPIQREEVLLRVDQHLQHARIKKQLVDSQKISSLSKMIKFLSHQINTPIGNSLMSSSNLLAESKKLSEHFAENHVGKKELSDFIELSYKASKIIDDNLLAAAKLIKSLNTVTSDENVKEHFHIITLLEDLLVSLDAPLKEHNINVTISCPHDLQVYQYQLALTRVLMIVFDNIIHHAFVDEPQNESQNEVQLAVEQEGEKIIIKISDNGVGIAKENVDSIFDPCFTTKVAEGFSGMGLHLAYNLVDQCIAGNISCVSHPNQGTTIIVEFSDLSD